MCMFGSSEKRTTSQQTPSTVSFIWRFHYTYIVSKLGAFISTSPFPCLGALTGDMGESGLTHLVVSDDVDPAHIPSTPFRIHMVKQQWFWESIQIEASADEQLYQVKVSKEEWIGTGYRVLQNPCGCLNFDIWK